MEYISKIYETILDKLKTKEYVLADTRVPFVTLYDHLVLTAGIAVAMLKELILRGKAPGDIAGYSIQEEELTTIARAAALLHDWGKDDPEKHRNHVKRSIEWASNWLESQEIPSKHRDLILGAIGHHEIKFGPESLVEKITCLADSMASGADRSELAKAKTLDELIKITRSTLVLERAIFGDTKKESLSLLLGDVDRVKDYVFETTKLPEIRGASEILNELNLMEVKNILHSYNLSDECLVYAGGGTFLAIVPYSLADSIIEKIKKTYLAKTKVTTITIVKSPPLGYLNFARGVKPYTDREIKDLNSQGIATQLLRNHFGRNKEKWPQKKNFTELVTSLSSELRYEKHSQKNIPFILASPIERRCDSCGKRGAICKDSQTSDFLCEVCENKRRKGRIQRTGFIDEFKEWLIRNKNNFKVEGGLPVDLDTLAGSEKDYLAYVYADGNNIGGLLEKAKSPAAYRHISEQIKNGTENALFEALYITLGSDNSKYQQLPFEIINIGGDDISIIIQAKYVWLFAMNFLEQFEYAMQDLAKELGMDKITSSVGFLASKPKYPVFFMEKLSDSLLKEAKGRVKETSESAMSFMYLTNPVAAYTARELIDAYYLEEQPRIQFSLTMRPYTLKQSKVLWETAKEIRDIYYSTQRNLMMQALAKGVKQSTNFILYQIGRMTEDKRKKAERVFERLKSNLGCNYSFPIWKLTDKGIFATPLLDVMEIIKFSGGVLDGKSTD